MKKNLILTILKVSAILLLPIFLSAESIWIDRNIYSSSGGYKTGDVLIVNINDISTIKFTQNSSDKNTLNLSSNPDKTITGFLPNVAADKSSSTSNNISFDGKNSINFSMATTVTGSSANGQLNIVGSRTYSFNGVNTAIRISGAVDPTFIDGRGIDSASISNFRISVNGSKSGVKFNIPLPEPTKVTEDQNRASKKDDSKNTDKAKSTKKPKKNISSLLSETEKNRIAIDYLQKMLGELTR